MRTVLRRAISNAQRRNAYLMERRLHEVQETEDQENQIKKAKDKENQIDKAQGG